MFGRSELNDMWKAIGSVVFLGVFFIWFISWFVWFMFFYSDVGCDYKTIVKVDDSSKVEWAISNAVNDVKSRNFIMTKLTVETWHDKEFKITCGGVDRGNLLKR